MLNHKNILLTNNIGYIDSNFVPYLNSSYSASKASNNMIMKNLFLLFDCSSKMMAKQEISFVPQIGSDPFLFEKIKNNKELEEKIVNSLQKQFTNHQSLITNQFILVTGHRRENHGKGFINICEALKTIALQNPSIDIVYPVHLNQNVQRPVKDILLDIPNIYLIEPLQYEQFIYMMDKSYFIITDSGGVQEEAPSLGKPVLVIRNTTERPEALISGTVKLVGTDKEKIVKEAQKLIDDKNEYERMSKAHNPYGNGKASQKIIDFISRKILC